MSDLPTQTTLTLVIILTLISKGVFFFSSSLTEFSQVLGCHPGIKRQAHSYVKSSLVLQGVTVSDFHGEHHWHGHDRGSPST